MEKKNNHQQLSLFDFGMTEEVKTKEKKKTVPVAKGIITGIEEMTYDQMFDGYTSLKATTFSGGLAFIDRICQKFEEVQLVFGSDKALPTNTEELIIMQQKLCPSLLNKTKYPRLAEMAENGALTIYITNGMVSHAKVYLLKGENGKRIITGSSNFSKSAFSGKQLENINIFDSADDSDFDSKFEWFEDFFERLKEKAGAIDIATVRASLKSPDYFDNHPEKIPVATVIEQNGSVDLDAEDNASENIENIKYILCADPARAADALSFIRNAKKKDEPHITRARFVEAVSSVKKSHRRRITKAKPTEVPHLKINPGSHTVSYDDNIVDLNSLSEEKIKSDAKIISWYFSSLQKAWLVASPKKNVDYTLKQFWRFLVWSFVSPFFPYLRYREYEISMAPSYSYPVYALLNGVSGSGKTRFAEFIMKMMSNIHISVLRGSEFTKTNVIGNLLANDGIILSYDEVSRDKFTRSRDELIKNNMFGLNDDAPNRLTYPGVCILSNNIKSIPHDIARRMIRFYSEASMTTDEGEKHRHDVISATRNVTNSIFLEFTKEMFPYIDKIIEFIVMDNREDSEPDIFLIASSLLLDIIKRCGCSLPDQISAFTTSDCMGDAAQGSTAVDRLLRDFQANPNSFDVFYKQNLVRFTPPNTFKSSLASAYQDLPKIFQANFTSGAMTFNLSVAEENGFDFSKQMELEREKAITHLIDLYRRLPHFFSFSDGYVAVKEGLTDSAIENEYLCLESVTDIMIDNGSLKIPEKDFVSLTGIKKRRKFKFFKK